MPELPEVETVLRGLLGRAVGRRITSVEVHHPGVITGSVPEFISGIEGRRIQSITRRGKVLIAELEGKSDPIYLVLRLGMTGQVTIQKQTEPVEPHTHVLMRFESGAEELRFRDPRRFGRLRIAAHAQIESLLGSLGPDAHGIPEAEFFAAMRNRHGAIKSWLMNQQRLAGLGNIYADEALFEARIHPLAQPGRVSKSAARRLHQAVQRVLAHAIELQGTSFRDYIDIEGRPGNFLQKLRVYQRTGEPCPRCGRPIRRIVVGGRSSHFCPHCQPRPKYS